MGQSLMKRLAVFTLILSTASGLGCGLSKREDAQDTQSLVTQKFAQSLQTQSSVSRTSGMGTHARLRHLFPNGTLALPEIDFAFEGASGLNRAFGLQSRPFEPLAQMALREKVAALCETHLADRNTRIFSLEPGEQLLTGESAPTDPAAALALAAARNAWLHPYKSSDPEIVELTALYQGIRSGNTETLARKSLCMAVLLAPQFWLGAPESSDAARRVSIELFHTIPTMQELQDFVDQRVTMDQYFDRLFANAATKEQFKSTVRSWHEEWLGLRDIFHPDFTYADRRAGLLEKPFGASNALGVTFAPSPVAVAGGSTQTIESARLSGLNSSQCTTGYQQAFDPDTKMISWEHWNYDTNAVNFVGGFIRTGATLLDSGGPSTQMSVASTAAALEARASNNPMPAASGTIRQRMIADICNVGGRALISDQDGVAWRRCNGLLQLNAASLARTKESIRVLLALIGTLQASKTSTTYNDSNWLAWCPLATRNSACLASGVSIATRYRDSAISDIRKLLTRIKRYTSSGPVTFASDISAQVTATSAVHLTATSGQDAFTAFFVNATSSNSTSFLAAFDAVAAANSWHFETDLADIKAPSEVAGRPGRYNYGLGAFDAFGFMMDRRHGLQHLPLMSGALYSGVLYGTGFTPSDRRVKRLGGGGTWQDGYSKVKLWYTGEEVNVCNASDRLWASCFFRPNASVPVREDPLANYSPIIAKFWATPYQWLPDSAMHPQAVTAFYCGKPDASRLATFNSTDPNEAYSTNKLGNSGGINEVATNIDLQSREGLAANTPIGHETAVFEDLTQQIRDEPYELINKLVLDGGDYRELLTAEYTYGNACLKLFYDTQGYYLPLPDPQAVANCNAASRNKSRFSAGAPIPIGQLATVSGDYQGSTPERRRMWQALNGGSAFGSLSTPQPAPAQLPARVYSGILTMPLFVAPVATKARGMASRYFARLLCDQPNYYDPLQDATQASEKSQLHRSFVSERKHLEESCYQCHRNLDPLASALSWTFQGLLHRSTPSDQSGEQFNNFGGEGASNDYLGELDFVEMKERNIVGLRHGGGARSAGAFQGQSVNGIHELGVAISSSDKFASCVTQTMFQNVFGRPVQFADIPFFQEMVKNFKDPKGSNYRYVDLIKSMIKSDYFKRKN